MSRRFHLGFLLLGVAAFAVLVAEVGPARLLVDIRSAGWVAIPAVALYAIVYLASSEAWRLTMPPPPLSSPRAFAITAWSFALNYVTPFVSVGGEPFKIAAAAQWLGARAATASVIGERLLHVQAHLLFFLTGVLLAAALLPGEAVGAAGLLVAAAVFIALAALVLSVHRRGGIAWLLAIVRRLPMPRRHATWLEARQPAAAAIDAQMTALTRDRPGRYAMALAVEFAARCIAVLELLIITRAFGVPIDYPTAFLIAVFLSLAVNLFFFIPLALGAREGGLALIFGLLGLPPALGVAVSVVGRVREMAWIAIGLALGLATRRPAASGRS